MEKKRGEESPQPFLAFLDYAILSIVILRPSFHRTLGRACTTQIIEEVQTISNTQKASIAMMRQAAVILTLVASLLCATFVVAQPKNSSENSTASKVTEEDVTAVFAVPLNETKKVEASQKCDNKPFVASVLYQQRSGP